MSNFELELLAYNLEYDLAEFTELYLLNMARGKHNYKEMFKVYLLETYVALIAQYDFDKYDMNILSDIEMVNILDHTNVIINKNYSYDFKKDESIF